MKKKERIRMGVFQSHPIQYFAPLWRLLSKDSKIDLTVFYLSNSGVTKIFDGGFGQDIAWDIPLLDGYKSIFLNKKAKPDQRFSMRINSVKNVLRAHGLDCVLIPGYSRPFEWQVLWAAKSLGIKVIMRGDFSKSRNSNLFWNILRSAILRRLYTFV
ncbi:MAG TPA: glycosyltransferase family 1 protein, partial [Bacteroidia bacterium]|nr:glycosyltransferase family 1 protein [Bacteroidia bacterium]